jgi:hypothetical protein
MAVFARRREIMSLNSIFAQPYIDTLDLMTKRESTVLQRLIVPNDIEPKSPSGLITRFLAITRRYVRIGQAILAFVQPE